MSWLQEDNFGVVKANQYATGGDFCRIFTEDLDSLYQLSVVMTGNEEKAEQCFLAALEDCIQADHVPTEGARCWAKRTIIQKAIRALQLHPRHANSENRKRSNRETDSILAPEDFERFIFVMSVLERYSEQECALLLGCPLQEVRKARTRALGRIADLIRSFPSDESVLELQES
jgi:hypothetical protein